MKAMAALVPLASVLITSCEDPVVQGEHILKNYAARQSLPQPGDIAFAVQVLSDPPGARIEVNGDYIGDAPCTIEVYGDKNRMCSRPVTIVAIPSEAGQYSQTKAVSADALVPHKILMAMNLGPVAPQVDVNINQ